MFSGKGGDYDVLVVPKEYWKNHKPYRIRRSTVEKNKEERLDDELQASKVYEQMAREASSKHIKAPNFYDNPEYEIALKEYMAREIEYEKTKERQNTCGSFCNWGENKPDNYHDPKSVGHDYWENHKPWTISRKFSSSDSADDDEDDELERSKYADGEYDEVRKVRMYLEKLEKQTMKE